MSSVSEILKTGSFPDSLKCANVRPIYKKVDPFDKKELQTSEYITTFIKAL